MIDYFTLALTNGLIAVVLWRLAFRPELDVEAPEQQGGKQRPASGSLRAGKGRAAPRGQGHA